MIIDKKFIKDFKQKLKKVIKRNDGKYRRNHYERCERILNVFTEMDIDDYEVDYDIYNDAISINLFFNNDIDFLLRNEGGDESIIEYSIREKGTTVKSGFDKLSVFKEHVRDFFNLQVNDNKY